MWQYRNFRILFFSTTAMILADMAIAQIPNEPTFDKVTVGSDETQHIDTNLDGSPVPADIGQIYIGNTVESADAITIDSGSNFPGGIAFRRYLGSGASPTAVTSGTQLGYLDFRGFSGSQFWNAGSLDMVVDPLTPFVDGALMPTKMRFAVSDGQRVFIPMELLSNGRLELGAILDNGGYAGPGSLGNAKLFVNQQSNNWSTIFVARPDRGLSYGLRVHTSGETSSDYILGGSSGAGTGSFKFSVRGNGDVHVGGKLLLGSVDVAQELTDVSSVADAALLTANNAEIVGNNAFAKSIANEDHLRVLNQMARGIMLSRPE